MNNLKGWRTFALGLAIAVGPAALTYLAGVDWTKLVSPNTAMLISGGIMFLMRAITTTPPGKSS